MRGRSLVVAVLAWCAVVVVASAVTWGVISSTGGDVLSDAEQPVAGVTPTSAPTAAGSPSTGEPTGRPRPSRPPSDTATPSAPRTSAPPPQPEPRSQTRTWQGRAGTVVVRCDGDRATLESATPGDGYGVEVKRRDVDEVEVDFEADDDLRVRAACVGGGPRFEVDS